MKQAAWKENGSSYIARGIGLIVSDTKWKSRLRKKGMKLFFRKGNIQQALINGYSEEKLNK